jgi:hypothetical protein
MGNYVISFAMRPTNCGKEVEPLPLQELVEKEQPVARERVV